MKRKFRIAIDNNTNRELLILPLQRRLLPFTREILEQRFSKPLSIRMARLSPSETTTYTTTINTAFDYSIKFKKRRRRMEWKVAVSEDGNSIEPQVGDEPEVICVISSEDGTRNVPPGGEDD